MIVEFKNKLLKIQVKTKTQKVEVTNPQPVVSPDFSPLVNAVYELKKDLGKPSKAGKTTLDLDPLLESLAALGRKLDLLYEKGEGNKYHSRSKSFTGNEDDLFGSGVPDGAQLKAKYIMRP